MEAFVREVQDTVAGLFLEEFLGLPVFVFFVAVGGLPLLRRAATSLGFEAGGGADGEGGGCDGDGGSGD